MSTETSLTTGEQRKLKELEAEIEAALNAFYELGRLLREVRDRSLYTDFETFEGYCKKRWGISRPRAYQLIASTQAVENLSTMVDISPPSNERQARILADIESPQDQANVWVKANETAPKDKEGNPRVTAAHVAKVRDEVLGNGKAEPEAEPEEKQPAEPKPILDALKQAVPEKLLPAFECRASFSEIGRRIDELRRDIEKLAGEPGGFFLAKESQSIAGDLRQLKYRVTHNGPHAVVKHKGNHPGWVSEIVWKGLPDEQKKVEPF